MSDRDEDVLELGLRDWSKHWDGGNNKYPPITVLNLESLTQVRKLVLLENILDERRGICKFAVAPRVLSKGAQEALESGRDAVFIPSGGKSAEWCWQKNKKTGDYEWWWARLAEAKAANVFLVVSFEEFETYLPACRKNTTLHLVGYEGFGIGCGRAISVRLLTQFRLKGVITDDRTDSVDYSGPPLEGTIEPLIGSIGEFPMCSVGPKAKLNILTLFDGTNPFVPSKTPGMLCFPSTLMASKEDLCLWSMTKTFAKLALKLDDLEDVSDHWEIIVHTDTANPEYKNTAVVYEGTKKAILEGCIKSRFFVDSKRGALNAQVWKATYGFLNLWDMIKMQESAIYQLIDSLGDIEPDNVPVFLRILETHFFAPR